MRLQLGVLASGNGSNLQAIIDAIEAGKLNADIHVVLSDKPEAYALARAEKHKIPCLPMHPSNYQTREDFDGAMAELLDDFNVDFVVLAGYMRIVTNELLKKFRKRVINIHPALLPSFPGLHGQRQAVEYGVKVSGCTVHFVDDGLDSGPIIAQRVVPVLDDDTEETLAARILEQEHQLLPEVLQWISEGRVHIDGRKVTIDK